MAKRPTPSQRRRFAALIAKLEPEVREAFEASVRALRDGVDWDALVDALERRDLPAAISALHLDESAFYAFATAKTAAFAEAGALTAALIDTLEDVGVFVRFDMANPRAQQWIIEHVGRRITRLVEGQLELARQTILDGYARGRHPNDIARDLVGRVTGGTRAGGVIGLDTDRAARLRMVTLAMETPDGVKSLVTVGADGIPRVRLKLPRSVAASILGAFNKGRAVPEAKRRRASQLYQNALLQSRGETIARTETAQAVRGAQVEEWEQFTLREGIPDEAIQKTWIHGGGVKDPRPHHVAANGMVVTGLETAFQLSNGAVLAYPHDPRAPGSETINCTCGVEIRVDPQYGVE